MARHVMVTLFATCLILCFAPSAHAQADQQDPGTTDPCFSVDYSWEQCDSSLPPTIQTCTATSPQQCRKCHENLTALGQHYSWECWSVRETASCRCSTGTRDGCTSEGKCTYHEW
jgi:hypothetical protein